jgi:hypothetical protein
MIPKLVKPLNAIKYKRLQLHFDSECTESHPPAAPLDFVLASNPDSEIVSSEDDAMSLLQLFNSQETLTKLSISLSNESKSALWNDMLAAIYMHTNLERFEYTMNFELKNWTFDFLQYGQSLKKLTLEYQTIDLDTERSIIRNLIDLPKLEILTIHAQEPMSYSNLIRTYKLMIGLAKIHKTLKHVNIRITPVETATTSTISRDSTTLEVYKKLKSLWSIDFKRQIYFNGIEAETFLRNFHPFEDDTENGVTEDDLDWEVLHAELQAEAVEIKKRRGFLSSLRRKIEKYFFNLKDVK